MQRDGSPGTPGAMTWITVAEAARQLAVSSDFIYGEIRAGRLPAARFGTRVAIEQKDLNSYAHQQRTAGPPPTDRGSERGVRLVAREPTAVGRRGFPAKRSTTNRPASDEGRSQEGSGGSARDRQRAARSPAKLPGWQVPPSL